MVLVLSTFLQCSDEGIQARNRVALESQVVANKRGSFVFFVMEAKSKAVWMLNRMVLIQVPINFTSEDKCANDWKSLLQLVIKQCSQNDTKKRPIQSAKGDKVCFQHSCCCVKSLQLLWKRYQSFVVIPRLLAKRCPRSFLRFVLFNSLFQFGWWKNIALKYCTIRQKQSNLSWF